MSENQPPIPRLVPIEVKRPTLDQMPEGEPHRCVTCGCDRQIVLCRVGKNIAHVDVHGKPMQTLKHEWAAAWHVLDAPPITPKTVGELEPGMVFQFADPAFGSSGCPWAIKRRARNAAVFPDGSELRHVPDDTPITGPVYRWEVGDGSD